MYAEVLNENGSDAATVLGLVDPIRMRAGVPILDLATLTTVNASRQAIQDERRPELAFEGQRFFYLVRTNTVSAELG